MKQQYSRWNDILTSLGLSFSDTDHPFTPPFSDKWHPFWEKISADSDGLDALAFLQKYASQKQYVLRRYFADQVDMVQQEQDVALVSRADGKVVATQSELPFIIEELHFTRREVWLRGRTQLLSAVEQRQHVQIWAAINGAEHSCRMPSDDPSEYKNDELKCLAVSFELRLPLSDLAKQTNISFTIGIQGLRCPVSRLRFGDFAPLNDVYKHHYYAQHGWACLRSRTQLHMMKISLRHLFRLERAFLDELKSKPSALHQEAQQLRISCILRRLLPARQIWLISDRYDKADDNGEALFRHLCAHPERGVKPYFVISEASPDYQRLKAIGPVVSPDSPDFRKLLLCSRYVISSHADRFTVHPLGKDIEPYRDLCAMHDFIFLQHGVALSNISSTLNRTKQNMRLFVTAARPEHASVLQEPRYQCEQIACLTGLARFDRLYNDPKKIITVMPTWRKYLAKPQSTVQDEHALVDDFTSSDFFRTYNALLNHPRLLAAAKRTGYSVRFMPHPLLRSAMPLFQRNEQVDFYPYDARYRDIFAESDLIITDYSSAVVDFAYLRKPVVYFHFDREEFTSGKHIYIPGYFDYETMGFGEVTYDLETLVDCIIGYMDNHCSMKPEYVQRADAFFAFNDKNNCRRLLDEIAKLSST